MFTEQCLKVPTVVVTNVQKETPIIQEKHIAASIRSSTSYKSQQGYDSRIRSRHPVRYFEGPRDTQRHSKLPLFMQLHGGILPKMILPLVFVGSWATTVCLIDEHISNVGVDTVLLTVLGFVVAFAVSFRTSTAYERYMEGRRYWALLTTTSRNLGRLVWFNMLEREDDEENPQRTMKDLMGKLTAINMIVAYAVALKYRLRFEPAVDYPDLHHLIAPISTTTMASKVEQSKLKHKKTTKVQQIGEYLGLTFAVSNPRKLVKQSDENLGNLPHEILSHLSGYIEKAMATKQIVGCHRLFWNDIRTMADILAGTERILNTPLPQAYTISVAQITWMYIMVLPFQLINKLGYITIPATMLAAYIILGLAMIGAEIENPFGQDVNDLPLEQYCCEIQSDLDILVGLSQKEYEHFTTADTNRPLYPMSAYTANEWLDQDMEQVRALLKAKATDAYPWRTKGQERTAFDMV